MLEIGKMAANCYVQGLVPILEHYGIILKFKAIDLLFFWNTKNRFKQSSSRGSDQFSLESYASNVSISKEHDIATHND